MEKTDQKPLQKEKRTRSAGRIAGMAAGIAVGVLAAAYLAVCIAAAAGKTTLRRTQVLGVDVGGLTAQEVRDKWQRDGADACSGEVIHLTLGEETIGQVSLGYPLRRRRRSRPPGTRPTEEISSSTGII